MPHLLRSKSNQQDYYVYRDYYASTARKEIIYELLGKDLVHGDGQVESGRREMLRTIREIDLILG